MRKKQIFWKGKIIASIVIIFFLISFNCAPKKELKPKVTPPKPEEKVEEIPKEDLAIIKEVPKEKPKVPEEEQKYNLALEEADIRDVLLLISRDTDISILIDPDVKGTIPIVDLKKVALGKILYYILPTLGLDYSWDGKILRVFKQKMETRVFYLNYIAASREGSRDVIYTSRAGGAAAGGGVAGGGVVGGGSEAQSRTDIRTRTATNLWSDLQTGLESVIFGKSLKGTPGEVPTPYSYSDGTGRKLLISPQTGIVMITDFPEKINQAAYLIEALEGSAHRQVWIEAKMIEVILDRGHQMGVNWSAVLNPKDFFGTLPSTDTLKFPSIKQDVGNVTEQALNPSYGSFQYAISNNKIDLLIDALSRQGNLNVLSSPRVSALNNEKAVIRVVREEAFFSMQTFITAVVTGAITAPSVYVQIVPVGIVMDIIPQISPAGEIILSINPDISELVEIRQFQAEGTMATQPVIDRRSIDTVAKAKNGETIVIAGIIRERKKEVLRGVPFLMKVPFLGTLFRRTEQVLERSELVILITPTLMVGKKIIELTEEEKRRIEEATRPFHFGDIDPWKEGIKGELRKRN
ncbi:MAG: secretin N-terminal domain-containing protein [Acidobacteriota bacterium]